MKTFLSAACLALLFSTGVASATERVPCRDLLCPFLSEVEDCFRGYEMVCRANPANDGLIYANGLNPYYVELIELDRKGTITKRENIRLSGVVPRASRAEAIPLASGAVALVMIRKDSRVAPDIEFVNRIDIFDRSTSQHKLSIIPSFERAGQFFLIPPEDISAIDGRVAIKRNDGAFVLANPNIDRQVVERGYRAQKVLDRYGAEFQKAFIPVDQRYYESLRSCANLPEQEALKCRQSANEEFRTQLKRLRKLAPKEYREDVTDILQYLARNALIQDIKSYLTYLDGTFVANAGDYNDPNFWTFPIFWELESNPYLSIVRPE